MFAQFERHIKRKKFFSPELNYLLAFSSGADSVVLADLLHKAGVSFAIAHCNFNLRGTDSEQDAAFAEAFAKERGITFYYQSFDTKTYQRTHQPNTQLAARELRYNWFHELLNEKQLAKLITAHHANDNLETVLINALRGSGVMGFKGIQEVTKNSIRPLLPFTKEQVLDYAQAHQLAYRTDKSNWDVKYERNYIRAKVVPLLKALNPSLEATMYANTQHVLDWIALAETYLQERKSRIVLNEGTIYRIDKQALLAEEHKRPLLFSILYPFGFNGDQINQLLEVLISAGNHSGTMFYSSSHALLIDRAYLLVKPGVQETVSQEEYLFNDLMALHTFPFLKLTIERGFDFNFANPRQLPIDKSQLVFPLKIRHKKTGDRFMPFGMKRHQKLSDFFINNKFSEFDKEQTWILENGNGDIIWIMGYRNDERYRVNKTATDLFKLEIK